MFEIDGLAICKTCRCPPRQWYTPGVVAIGRIRFHPTCRTAWLAAPGGGVWRDNWPRPRTVSGPATFELEEVHGWGITRRRVTALELGQLICRPRCPDWGFKGLTDAEKLVAIRIGDLFPTAQRAVEELTGHRYRP